MITSTDGKVILFPINEARPDSESIIQWLNVLAVEFGRNPDIRAYAELILPAIGDNDLEGAARALIRWVKDHITFLPDPEGTEYVISPLVVLERVYKSGKSFGDCDDHCLVLVALMRSIGIEARIIGVKQGPASTWFDHVIVQVPTERGWVDVDPCAKEGPAPEYREKLIM